MVKIMKFRAPTIPLITIDPYFSVWSSEKINTAETFHWSGSNNGIKGLVLIDGEPFRFIGAAYEGKEKEIELISLDYSALTTTMVFRNEKIELTAKFTSPLLADDLYYASRPISYLKVFYKSIDSHKHDVFVKISCSEEFVLNLKGEGRAFSECLETKNYQCIRMSKGNQKVLWRSGDDVRIDWGSFYLAASGEAKSGNEVFGDMYAVYVEKKLENEALFVFAYDDIYSFKYFGEPVKAYWKKDGKTIQDAISEAFDDYSLIFERCEKFSEALKKEAVEKGGEKYAELLLLAYRQVMAAHKLAIDNDGEIIYISKECFSNGCAATVDVTYPSSPMYLYYNTELLKGMLRPILKYARSAKWTYDFAPHDVGEYPILEGQVYGENALEFQMPVEECGNMIILMAAISKKDGNADFAIENIDLLEKWNEYLVKYGIDPDNQLCTDDFAGHLSHNCNLALKAIMGIAGFAEIKRMSGDDVSAEKYMKMAKEYAEIWCSRAKEETGGYRLAFDRPGTYSLKYNAIWDRLWKTELFPQEMFEEEIMRYKKEAKPYGIPLDSREKYTKSDWELWVACFAEKSEDFQFFIDLLWNAYNTMRTRVPMTDWYYTDTSEMTGFRNRTVIGGLFMRLLFDQYINRT